MKKKNIRMITQCPFCYRYFEYSSIDDFDKSIIVTKLNRKYIHAYIIVECNCEKHFLPVPMKIIQNNNEGLIIYK